MNLADLAGKPSVAARLRVTIDFALLRAPAEGPGTPAAQAAGLEMPITRPGLSISTCAPGWDLHEQGPVLALAAGGPRFRTQAVQALADRDGQAAAWSALYPRSGERACEEAGGHYALVIIDRALGRVLLATDRFAVWPLCYRREGARLHVSDRADAVQASHAAALDLQGLYDYFYFHAIPAPRTVYAHVMRLQAGHMLLADARGTEERPHWWPRFEEHRQPPVATLREQFLAALRRAVAAEAAGGNLACFLSGGTDSSTVAGMVAATTGRPAHTYSIGFDVPGYDEMEYAHIAARHFRTVHHSYYVGPDDVATALPQLAASFDQPFGNSSALPAYCCALLASGDGHAKLLAGDGGDELFGGNTRYAKQRVFDLYRHIPAGLRHRLIEPFLAPALRHLPVARKAASYVEQARIPMPDRLETYNLLRRLDPRQIFTQQFLAQVDTHAPLRQQRAVYAQAPGTALINRMLAYDWKYTLADNDLVKVRGAAALAGIAVGFPLLADELVDFSLQLPPEMKLNGFKLRYFFKQALTGTLPPAIIAKKKHGFGLPFGRWLAQHHGLQSLASDALSRLARRGIVRAEFLSELSDARMRQHAGYYGEMVWILSVLELWLAARLPDWRVDT
jgi:asparagine synthase (glutamine-hydrolysing)